jgi:hypothetical protein
MARPYASIVAVVVLLSGVAVYGADVKVTLILVPERVACGNGEYGKNCDSPDIDVVASWTTAKSPYKHFRCTLRPGAQPLILDPDFFEKFSRLVEYDVQPSDPDKRFSIVLYFSGPPRKKEVVGQLTRGRGRNIPPLPEPAKIPISTRGRGFTHERADAFKPENNVQWKLDIQQAIYRFVTEAQ